MSTRSIAPSRFGINRRNLAPRDIWLGRELVNGDPITTLDAPLNVRYWTKADKGEFWARDGLSVNDPKRTLAVHCGIRGNIELCWA